ncbi:hypothetical protein BN11_40018 [Nostocoides australiense Ben110]|uniref:Uncharacterized protein n=1 Tax=Nostocoides australiense Ben110 TaxID=1193182 RepID=W6K406_9MICO|nr:hypothetical protein BN11_40018 [Tetrasphaera australiensis Ben110]
MCTDKGDKEQNADDKLNSWSFAALDS